MYALFERIFLLSDWILIMKMVRATSGPHWEAKASLALAYTAIRDVILHCEIKNKGTRPFFSFHLNLASWGRTDDAAEKSSVPHSEEDFYFNKITVALALRECRWLSGLRHLFGHHQLNQTPNQPEPAANQSDLPLDWLQCVKPQKKTHHKSTSSSEGITSYRSHLQNDATFELRWTETLKRVFTATVTPTLGGIRRLLAH